MDSLLSSLEKSTDGGDLYRSHKDVVQYYSQRQQVMELCYDQAHGKQWTDDEMAWARRKKKVLLTLNQFKPAQRTIMGTVIQSKYDIKFSPRFSGAQDLSDVLEQLYIYTAYSQGWRFKDLDTVLQAWIGGIGYQDIYIDVQPGREPKLHTAICNPFAVFWDPESRTPITREDAEFVDRDTWITFDVLQDKWPDIFTDETQLAGNAGQVTYTANKIYADRSAEFYDQKNGRYKLTERYYKVRAKAWYALDPDYNRVEIKDKSQVSKFKQEGYQVFSENREYLNLAIICPAYQTTEYLFNDRYHCQPRDVETDQIIWPLLEMVAEHLNGDINGFVEPLIGEQRLINSAASTQFHAQKHAASTSLLRKKKLFANNEAAKQDFDANHSDGDRVFEISDQAEIGTDIAPIPRATVSPDVEKTYLLGKNEFHEKSSAPPALQGAPNAGNSGVQTQTLRDQASLQSQPFIENLRLFQRQRAKLVQYYWREFYTYPMEIRILGQRPSALQAQQSQSQPPAAPGPQAGPPAPGSPNPQPAAPQRNNPQGPQPSSNPPQFIKLNQEVAETDFMGRIMGTLKKVNDLSTAEFDVDVEDSVQSPSSRTTRLEQLTQILQSGGSGMDPQVHQLLLSEFIKASDLSQDVKDQMDAMTQQAQQASSQPKQDPPKINFSFKGEDLTNPVSLSLVVPFLPPDVAQMAMQKAMQQAAQPQSPIDPAQAQSMQHAQDMHLQTLAQNQEAHQADLAMKAARMQTDAKINQTNAAVDAAKLQTHLHDAGTSLQLKQAQIQGIHLKNAQHLQTVADQESAALTGATP